MELTQEHYRIGKVAYDAYIKQSGGVSLISGAKLPPFDVLKQDIKDAWAAAAIAVRLDSEENQLREQRKVNLKGEMHPMEASPAFTKYLDTPEGPVLEKGFEEE